LTGKKPGCGIFQPSREYQYLRNKSFDTRGGCEIVRLTITVNCNIGTSTGSISMYDVVQILFIVTTALTIPTNHFSVSTSGIYSTGGIGSVDCYAFAVTSRKSRYAPVTVSSLRTLTKSSSLLHQHKSSIDTSPPPPTTTTTTTTTRISDPLSPLSSSITIDDTSPTSIITSSSNNHISDRYIGIFVLLTVPLAWGTYTPVVKYLYTIVQPPVPGLVFSASYYVIATISLWCIILLQHIWYNNRNNKDVAIETIDQIDNSESFNIPPGITDITVSNDHQSTTTIQTSTSTIQSIPNSQSEDLYHYVYGGIELGLYLFIANLLQIIGLQTIPADRAGFLIQLTTLFVPLLNVLLLYLQQFINNMSRWKDMNQNDIDAIVTTNTTISSRTWLACALAFIGIVVFDINIDDLKQTIVPVTMPVATDISITNISPNSSLTADIILNTIGQINTGDYLIVIAALLYSLHVVRLGTYAKVCNALPLAASKASVETILSIGLIFTLLTLVGTDHVIESTVIGTGTTSTMVSSATTIANGFLQYVTEAGTDIKTFLSSIQTILFSNYGVDTGTNSNIDGIYPISVLLPAFGAILWTGWVTCAYTIFAQSFGQSRVQSTEANLIYSIQPLCTALFAYILLGETLSPTGIIGAFFIGVAVYMVAIDE
jgi:hypothetical protein